MLRYYAWALGEKTLGSLPFGKDFYGAVGRVANRDRRGKTQSFTSSLRLARKGKDLIPAGGTVLDIGTGWFHHDAFLLHLAGDYRIYLFDIEDKARLTYIANYLENLLRHSELVAAELGIDETEAQSKIQRLLSLKSREEIYEACGFVPCVTRDVMEPFLAEGSIDFMVSNCVLNHIPPRLLAMELHTLRQMLKPDGRMYHLLGHDDHWTFHDPSANRFNYYRYSDRYYRMFFETKLEYQNRLVKQEWLRIFDRVELEVEDYYPVITDTSRKEIEELPKINERFARYPLEELAIIHSYVLLRKREVPARAGGDLRSERLVEPTAPAHGAALEQST
jgi:SAM-dependent methyltransferase